MPRISPSVNQTGTAIWFDSAAAQGCGGHGSPSSSPATALPGSYMNGGCGRLVSVRLRPETGVVAYVVDECTDCHDRDAVIAVNDAAFRALGIQAVTSESTAEIEWYSFGMPI
jgi:hypothetical protein